MNRRETLTRIGKYPVLRKLGDGATSEVYLCHDPFATRDVAIKVILPDVFRERERGRAYWKLFVTEASLAGKLQHPHICPIYDAAAMDDLHYIVMEYVSGGTLEKFCRPDSLLPVDDIIEMAFKCTRALEYAHRMGITHRDIKPANILYVGETDLKITDFGAALVSTGESTQVSAIGSPAYMSPQQVKDHALDHRTDIYSLGVVMYHLLTGRLPFQASNNFSLIYQIVNVEVAPPSAHRSGITPGLDAVVMRAMAKDLAVRYQSWEEFAADLIDVFHSGASPDGRPQQFADSDKFENLRTLPFFADFTDAEIWEVVGIASWSTATTGDILMKEGEPGSFFCMLAEGQVKVSRKGRVLNVLHAGEPFGEMAYLSGSTPLRGADVIATTDARIITIPAPRLAQASDACRHKFDRAFIGILVERLSMANVRVSGV